MLITYHYKHFSVELLLSENVLGEITNKWKENKKYTLQEFLTEYNENFCSDWSKMGTDGKSFSEMYHIPHVFFEGEKAYNLCRRDNGIALYKLPYPHKVKTLIGNKLCRIRRESVNDIKAGCKIIGKAFNLKRDEVLFDKNDKIMINVEKLPFHVIHRNVLEYIVGYAKCTKNMFDDVIFKFYGKYDGKVIKVFKYISFNMTRDINNHKIFQTIYEFTDKIKMIYFYWGICEEAIFYRDERNIPKMKELHIKTIELANLNDFTWDDNIGYSFNTWTADTLIIKNCKNLSILYYKFKNIICI
jgi:hypothetical protein